jgi:RNA polymerase sigma-70 factor (ECF subfamily)
MQELPTPTAALLPRVARGDAAALEECMDCYAPLVWSLARKLTRDPATVEELVQEVFVDLWRTASRFDATLASESTWVATIARRRIIDRQRRAARAPTVELPDEAGIAEQAESGLAGVDARDEADRAARALEQIKPEQRRLILMAVVDGLTHQEIAAATGLPLGTVKSHIRRGLERAAELLRAPRREGPR